MYYICVKIFGASADKITLFVCLQVFLIRREYHYAVHDSFD